MVEEEEGGSTQLEQPTPEDDVIERVEGGGQEGEGEDVARSLQPLVLVCEEPGTPSVSHDYLGVGLPHLNSMSDFLPSHL